VNVTANTIRLAKGLTPLTGTLYNH
jgi:hypothetical protein